MYILGVSGGLRHDAAACLVQDGRIVAMAEEERFTRQKYARRAHPLYSVAACLHQAGIALSDVDRIALGWEPVSSVTLPIEATLFSHPLFAGQRVPNMEPVKHHIAHAAAAFYSSGLDEASVLVVDGESEYKIATTLAYAKGSRIEVLNTYDDTQSLGHFYEALTSYLGFGYGEEGKVMGLAPYGKPAFSFSPIKLAGDGYTIGNGAKRPVWSRHEDARRAWLAWMETEFGPRDASKYKYDESYGRPARVSEPSERAANLAASGQAALESVILHLASLLVKSTGCRNMVIGGGVGLNCSANGALLRSGIVDDLYIFPASGDAGTSAGAALALYHQFYPSARSRRLDKASLGPAFSSRTVADILAECKIEAGQSSDIERETADLLAQGKVVGWFQGGMEVGPRALGNRSILALPTKVEMHSKVNSIKGREHWRPLAPSLLAEDARDYLQDARDAPFMLEAQFVAQHKRTEVPAVVHVDGTCRPQLVTTERNARFWRLLQQIKFQTNIPVVLNTSYNLRSEPLVCTPLDAIRTFYGSGLDALAIEDYLLVKQR